MREIPQLGHHFELCFSVDDLGETIDYYAKLGFKVYSGGRDKGWCTITDGLIHLGLFPDKFIEQEFNVPFLLNYRGGNMDKIVNLLKQQKIPREKEKLLGKGTGDAIIIDPNGVKLYFDTADFEERIDIPDA